MCGSHLINILLEKVKNHTCSFLEHLDKIPTYTNESLPPYSKELPIHGIGSELTLDFFINKFYKGIVSSSGARYFGFVTGGTTPAALIGDWLVSTFDQNATANDNSSAAKIEKETIIFLKQLFGLPASFSGAFVTGATMANFVGLSIGRQWIANQLKANISLDGLYSLSPIKVFSASPHSSILKTMSMLGMGKNNMHYIPTLKNREAIDIDSLEKYLYDLKGYPCIVVANAGTVNTADFDNLKQIGMLKKKYNFFLHIDAAFGGFAACSNKYSHLVDGIENADSLTIDAHKWLNIPYDCAMQFTKHTKLQFQVFQNNAVYLGDISQTPDYVHLVPENSRRLRALPVWFALKAYGKDGCVEIINRNCQLAQLLSKKIYKSKNFKLLSKTKLNVVCFTINIDKHIITLKNIQDFLNIINKNGKTFFTQTVYQGIPGIRAAISNWRTEENDISIAWEVLNTAYLSYINNL